MTGSGGAGGSGGVAGTGGSIAAAGKGGASGAAGSGGVAAACPAFSSGQRFPAGESANAVAIGDLNGDGKLDITVANQGAGSMSVLMGNGDGTYKATRDIVLVQNTGVYSVALGDLNEDTKLDAVLTSRESASGVIVLLGNGDGTFQSAQRVAIGPRETEAVVIADVNADHNRDLVVGMAGQVYVLLGNGDGTFQALRAFTAGGAANIPAVADLNGDGKLDIAVASNGAINSGAFVLLGNGDGTFQAPLVVAVGSDPTSIATADLNGDAKIDLVVASGNGANVALGNGDGTFRAMQSFASGATALSVAVGRIDRDAVLDLAVANLGSNTVSVLIGVGDGTFKAAQNLVTGTAPASTALGDLNGDGQLDVATANRSTRDVSVLLNAGATLQCP